MGSGRKMARAAARARGKHAAVADDVRDAIERLRQATIDAGDFAVPWVMFHDELVALESFPDAGVVASNETLRLIAQRALAHAVPELRAHAARFRRVDDFWHGMIETSAGVVVVYYYQRENLGLLGWIDGALRQHIIRISAAEAAPGATTTSRERGSA